MLLRICLVLAILAGIGVAVVSQTKVRDHIQAIIDERNTNANEREAQRARANNAEKQWGTTSNRLNAANSELASTKKDLEGANANLAQAQTARDDALKQLDQAKKDRTAALQDNEKWRQLSISPEQVRATIDNLRKAQEVNAYIEEEKKILTREVTRLTNLLAKFFEGESYEPPLPEALRGKVLVVDPKWEFVVLDVGATQGVLKDGVVMVHRDSKLVGKAKISSVMPERSIANILPGWKLDDIQEGDQVLPPLSAR